MQHPHEIVSHAYISTPLPTKTQLIFQDVGFRDWKQIVHRGIIKPQKRLLRHCKALTACTKPTFSQEVKAADNDSLAHGIRPIDRIKHPGFKFSSHLRLRVYV